jgi:hypothetical protein
MHDNACETGACRIIGRPTRITGLSTSTVLARIMAALDHANEWQRMQVFDIINARGFDEELSAGDVARVCGELDLPAAVLLSLPSDSLRGLDDLTGRHA